MGATMSNRAELLGLVGTLRKAVVLEEGALDSAIAARNTVTMRDTFHSLARLRARLSEAEREASEAD
jgi:hypothetical protein